MYGKSQTLRMPQTTDTITRGKVHIKDNRQMDNKGEKNLKPKLSSLFAEESK